ncbi:nuclease-related domain-containing protein [Arthrobacter sp. Br18]|uniref:nuclease-related domain-containing protein n=1 Tax=Arthrobacter sp. Br18 TaxID=1312954 RepID=UPI0009DED027|nr:nuclease-related domain-containing protein [Arthrobacter sp. Br18]
MTAGETLSPAVQENVGLPRGPLSERIPGQAVIEELLACHQFDPPRGRVGRLFGARPLGTQSTPWYWGALGEQEVGRILASLGPEWTVLHAVPVGNRSSDIDHVIIGPTGIVTLNTKRHADQPVWTARTTFMVSGKRQPHIHNSVYEADRAAKLLSRSVGRDLQVTAAIVVVGAKSVTVKEKHQTVAVLTPRQLLRWLTRRPSTLTPQQVAIVSAAAVLPETWKRDPPILQEPASIAVAFDSLRRAIDQARRRRVGWVLTMLVTVLGILSGALPTLLAGLFLLLEPS